MNFENISKSPMILQPWKQNWRLKSRLPQDLLLSDSSEVEDQP